MHLVMYEQEYNRNNLVFLMFSTYTCMCLFLITSSNVHDNAIDTIAVVGVEGILCYLMERQQQRFADSQNISA